MYILFFVLWIIFNGKITWEIVFFGLGIAAILDWFVIRFMGYQPGKTLHLLKKLPWLFVYVVMLLYEIFKANVSVIRLIYSAKYEVEPVLKGFQTNLKTDVAKVVLANSITLTPGTITVSVEGKKYLVHCLDKELAEGMDDSIFVKLLRRMEAK